MGLLQWNSDGGCEYFVRLGKEDGIEKLRTWDKSVDINVRRSNCAAGERSERVIHVRSQEFARVFLGSPSEL
jgi:hypothetical protein